MKKITYIKPFALLIAFISVVSFGYGQSIFTNPITGTNPNTANPYTTGEVVDANITVSGIGRGTGINSRNANDRYNANGWNTVGFDSTAYFEFTLTPNASYEINFNDFVYTGQASTNGPTNIAIRSSLDGYVANIGTPTLTGSTIDLSATTYQGITASITFRIYGWGGTNGSGTFSINDFTFNGSTRLAPVCPTTTTWTGSWSNGLPNSLTKSVVISSNYNTSSGDIIACSLTINSGAILTVDNDDFVEVENDVLVDDGELRVNTRSNFVQNVSAGTFTVGASGTASVNKVTALKQDWLYYTYWSSPVTGETIAGAFPDTDNDRRYWFNAANYLDEHTVGTTNGIPDDIDDNNDDWNYALGTDVLTPGVGYAAASGRLGFYPRLDSADFIGPFNTGDISTGISYNALNTTGSWNFIGNPYPSAIDFIAFQAANSSVIDGAAYFWSQSLPPLGTNPGNQINNFNQNDYATYTVGSGGVAGANGIIPTQYIPSAQGFFIAGLSNSNVTFTNAMRMADGTSNAQFFKNSNSKKNAGSVANKIWVNLTSDNGVFNQILTAYVNGATNGDDGMSYDARKLLSNESAILYTSIENSDKIFSVQGKSPSDLNENEIIDLGFKTTIDVATLYTLSIAQLQGDFLNNNSVYLKDNLLDITHNLSDSDYTFTSEVGEFNNRFKIVFTDKSLSTDDVNLNDNSLTIIELDNDRVNFKTSNSLSIKTVTIYDLLGRQLYNLKGNNSSEIYELSNLKSTIYIAKVELSNGITVTKKAIKK